MISFSDLYEAVVQQPTPPQQPVQPTGAQVQQQPQLQPEQPAPQQPTGIIGKIKSGYNKINDKYESGKDVVKQFVPIGASLAVPIGLYGASFVSNPALASTLRTVGMGAMMARPLIGAARQARMVAQQNSQPQHMR